MIGPHLPLTPHRTPPPPPAPQARDPAAQFSEEGEAEVKRVTAKADERKARLLRDATTEAERTTRKAEAEAARIEEDAQEAASARCAMMRARTGLCVAQL